MRIFFKRLLRSLAYNFYKHRDFLTPYERFEKEEILESYKYFKKFFLESVHFKNENDIRAYSVKSSINYIKKNKLIFDQFLFLEFGVYKGGSINFLANFLKNHNTNIYGFDTFEGFTEDWKGTFRLSGDYSNKSLLPKVSGNVKLIKGPVQKTIDKFILENKNKKIIFIHFDMDTYESTNFVLKKIKPLIHSEAYFLFDNFYNYAAWKVGEFKALKENFDESQIKYLGFAAEEQVLLKILKK